MEQAGTQGQSVGDIADVLQEPERPELGIPVSIPVSVDGPVQTHAVPSVSSGLRTRTVTATEAVRVANIDPRRRILRLLGTGGSFRVGNTQGEAANSMTSATWPASVVLELTHGDAVYAIAASTDVTLTIITENWAS